MKVQCGQCPAKYAVSDERVHDRKVRIHCKRCGASIIVDGKVNPPLVTSTPARPSVRPVTNAAPVPESPLPEPEPDSRPSPRAVAHTIMGGLEAPAAERLEQQVSSPDRPMRSPASPYQPREEEALTRLPSEQRGTTDADVGAAESRWRVALTQQDLRWMTTEEIARAYRAGAVKLETFVFRAGMPTWVTLPEVPEIAAALAEAGSPAAAPTSSLPPPKASSSRPPPRRVPARSNAAEANAFGALADLDSAEPMPFALVAQRSNGAATALDAEHDVTALPPGAGEPYAAPHAFEPPAQYDMPERPSIETVPAESLSRVPDEPGAPLPFAATQHASGSSKRVWLIVALLLLLAAVGAYLASRQGLKAF